MHIKVEDIPIAILAGGLATRMRPVSERIPKSLLPVAGKPFILHQLELLNRLGINRVVVCLGHLGEQVQEELKSRKDLRIKLDYSFDGTVLLGTGGAIKKALDKLGGIFFVIYGDSYLNTPIEPILDFFIRSGKNSLMTVFKSDGRYGNNNVIYKDNSVILYNKEHTLPEMRHIDYGLSLFKSSVFKSWTKETKFDLAEVIIKLVADDDVAGFEVKEQPYEVGSHKGLAEFEGFINTTVSLNYPH